ncbi:hypothetical protein NDU88_002918 [Pleurodeles waltl]|uniref:Uncharacterized protein n=1 Tax=Pleurodeles waltl TaxID=8319 RepID=A0AAV7WQ07_PLEWA|nr:hypothetical protein NDU88_002918 [Pleurodeles waltl]
MGRLEGLFLLNYVAAIGEESDDAFSSARKKCIILHCLGPVGQRVYTQMEKKQRASEDSDVFKNALEDLDAHYQPVLHDELIRDQIITHSKNTGIQEKPWVSGDAPLNEIIAIVKKAELSKRCAKAALSNGREGEIGCKVMHDGKKITIAYFGIIKERGYVVLVTRVLRVPYTCTRFRMEEGEMCNVISRREDG